MLLGGHRGLGKSDGIEAPPEWQENCLHAIQYAFTQGADFVEVDLVLDGDGHGWFCHSSALKEHLQNPPAKYIDELTTAEVSDLIGLGGEPLCSLQQALTWFGDRPMNIELKLRQGTGRPRGHDAYRLGSLTTTWPSQWWLSSFDLVTLEAASRVWPATEIGLLSLAGSGEWIYSNARCLSNEVGYTIAMDRGWRWHPQLSRTTRRLPAGAPTFGWSLGPDDEPDTLPEGLTGLITDRLSYWQSRL